MLMVSWIRASSWCVYEFDLRVRQFPLDAVFLVFHWND